MHQVNDGHHQVPKVEERITSRRLAAAFGMDETIPHLLMKQHLRWLGYVARMKPILVAQIVAVLGTRKEKTESRDQKEMA